MSTSSSDRYQAATAALAAHDDPSIEVVGADGYPLIGSVERMEWVISQLRPVIESAPVTEPIADIAERVLYAQSGTQIRNIVAAAVEAGIQAAWESWEPADMGDGTAPPEENFWDDRTTPHLNTEESN